jgi:hypothetical protein
MDLQAIKGRGTGTPIYDIVRNSEASAAIADGEVLKWTISTAAGTVYGNDVLKTAEAASVLVAGVAKGAIAVGEYGRMQVWGYHPNVKTTAAALAAGSTVNGDSAAAAVAGALGDDPSSRLGVCLKLGASNRAGIFIQKM